MHADNRSEERIRKLEDAYTQMLKNWLDLRENLMKDRENLLDDRKSLLVELERQLRQNYDSRQKLDDQEIKITKLEKLVAQLQLGRSKEASVSQIHPTLEVPPSELVQRSLEKPSIVEVVSPQDISRPRVESTQHTRERINYYNQALRISSSIQRKESLRREWPSMLIMAMDMDAYESREDVFLVENSSGSFYAIHGEGSHFEVYFDPGYSVIRGQVKAMFEVTGDGEYIHTLIGPAWFEGDAASAPLHLICKGKLIAK
ncbi:MAG: hypothetical protein H7Y22_14540 [Gemmatimonadaceae bacterium]|nr:hypothetical protein [Gloeobacterales cyanobacterium ES-bin-141]